ncbi:MAG: hypothetical protein KBD78_06845 [Oligoflexales bacterium]|nr:hypothetical protein [Oligoflexales bacterium]
MTAKTLVAWKNQAGVGTLVGDGYDRHLLGFSTGSRFLPFGSFSIFHKKLSDIAPSIDGLEVLSLNNLHFTFLALSPHSYSNPSFFPAELPILQKITENHLPGVNVRLSQLRLLPLPNALLLVGIPDYKSIVARANFANALLTSPWEIYLRRRYNRIAIPPLIWHCTIVRQNRQFFSPALRELCFDWIDHDFGEIQLEAPILAAVTYNWSKVYML